ncbi:hypothetical protein Mal52_27180 [Symmachiella dynata]|uniref:DUF374 domain-containing protein n=1 Tax=Symmachiella dynata TaxID=2527995 RepID=A0A517ZPA1_9PLAN|nr:lysophospholipid acyltransferase family protein [Symmachiella dynata]QDU44240.1 hypothetical protein Mal52_27180 [Symmachiella dynata]
MSFVRRVEAWLLAFSMLALRATCRIKLHNDPRPALKSSQTDYVYSILHAHQVSAAIEREKGTAAMVSQSTDGDLLLPGFWVLGIKPIRGSNRAHNQDKGGRSALNELIAHVQGGSPAYIAVDGPRGPRNHIRKGIAVLSRETNATVLNIIAVPTRRWILRKTWDRLQIPKPFCRIDAYFAEPLQPTESESVEDYRRRIQTSLNELEANYDGDEPVQAAALRKAKAAQTAN